MNLPLLVGISRHNTGKSYSRRLRREGYVPTVVYGSPSKAVSLEGEKLFDILKEHGENALFELKLEHKTFAVIIKEVQRHPITEKLLHVDLQPVNLNYDVDMKIPINLVNKEKIKQQGGVVQTQKKDIKVRSKPHSVPDKVTVDVSKLKPNSSLKVKDIEISQEVSIVDKAEEVVARFTMV